MLAGITMTTLTQCCSMFVRSCSWGQSQGHRVNGAAVAVTKPNCTAYRIEKLADGSWALRRYLLVVGFTACTYLMLLFVFFTFCNKICAMSKYSPRKPKKRLGTIALTTLPLVAQNQYFPDILWKKAGSHANISNMWETATVNIITFIIIIVWRTVLSSQEMKVLPSKYSCMKLIIITGERVCVLVPIVRLH